MYQATVVIMTIINNTTNKCLEDFVDKHTTFYSGYN